MSVASVGITMSRIKAANERSMIAVFRVYGADHLVNAVFDNTILSQSLRGSKDYIGSYHKNMDLDFVLDEIYNAIEV